MPAIYFQEPLPFDELASLSQEFPHYDFVTEEPQSWGDIEVLYGNHLTDKQLEQAPRLKWVHSPSADTDHLCLTALTRRQILTTISKGQNIPQMAEFVIGGILAFAKQFFHWPSAPHDPEEFWQWPLKETIWTLKNKVLLQVGLGELGTQVVKLANTLEMKTWGVRKEPSFHPYCRKTFPMRDLHSLLPHADVVVIALTKQADPKKIAIGLEEFTLMKPDSIFISVGSGGPVDDEALAKVAASGKFRGILLDTFQHPPPPKNSPLWTLPGAILTPSIASLPASEEHLAFRLFRQNLRVFAPGKINEMKNVIV